MAGLKSLKALQHHYTAHLRWAAGDGPSPAQFWLGNEQVAALELITEVEYAQWGRYRRHGPMALFDAQQPTLGAAPLAGEHNAQLLAELGYSADQVAALTADGVLWQN